MSKTDWPELRNYFGFYGLEPVYDIDTVALKRLFLEKSRQFHPDFFGDDMSDQAKAIEVTSYNNKAFKVLSQPSERIRYLIQLNDTNGDEEQKLPQAFLMEMMDLNEQIDEFAFAENKENIKSVIESEINQNLQQLTALLISLVNDKQWALAKSELLKVNYLERLSARLLDIKK